MNDKILSILKYINTEEECLDQSSSLFTGSPGLLMFNLLYYKHIKDGSHDQKFAQRINLLAENSLSTKNRSFGMGQSGIRWFFTYLYKYDYLDYEDFQIICSDNEFIAAEAVEYLKQYNYDYFHGALGEAYYLLYNPDYNSSKFFEEIFHLLLKMNELNDSSIPIWDVPTRKVDLTTINLGLAHGVTSILKFCLQCYKLDRCKKEAKLLADKIVDFLMVAKKEDVSYSYYASEYKIGETNNGNSRLGWCYGDLTMAFILYQYGCLFNRTDITQYALTILKGTTNRRTPELTLVNDASLCHGSAGIAHVYNKIWRCTGEPIFKEACDFWINDLINEVYRDENTIRITKYNATEKKHQKDIHLLEGAAGIGLSLLSYLTGDFSWDYCMMLND